MTDFILRPARAEDAEPLTHIHIEGKAAIPLPPSKRPLSEIVAYHRQLIREADVLVADQHGTPMGYIARNGMVIAQLYLAPRFFRQGAGRALLQAMRTKSALEFWCFAHNARAIAFYCTFGAVEIGRELGPENEEGLPALQLRIERG